MASHSLPRKLQNHAGVSIKYGVPFGGPKNKDYSILVFVLRVPNFGNYHAFAWAEHPCFALFTADALDLGFRPSRAKESELHVSFP